MDEESNASSPVTKSKVESTDESTMLHELCIIDDYSDTGESRSVPEPTSGDLQPLQMPLELQVQDPEQHSEEREVPQATTVPCEPRSVGISQATTQRKVGTSRSAYMLRIFKERAQRVSSALDEQQTREYHSKLQLMMSSERMLENSMAVLERQQQRLLLLRHAMWCTAPNETCVATPNCGETKRLWEHMSACQKPTCSYLHCVSSRYVLSHFQQCENSKCVVCQLLQYAVEVKEKDGSLVMSADRALRQIQLATEWQHRFAATVPELTRDETRQLEQIQVRLRGINLKALYLNSKQLEGHAEQLGNQVKAMMAEVRQLTQLCNSTHHPDLKKQYRDLLQRKNGMLRRITERLQKSTSQRRILHHVICARIKATTF